MRAVVVGLFACAALAAPPSAAADAAGALLVIDNASNVDVAFELSVDGARVSGCFWALRGKTTTFAVPAGKLAWSYMLAGMQFSGKTELAAGAPKKLACAAGQARTGDEIAKCSPVAAPDSSAAPDATALLASSTFGFLEELRDKLEKKDSKALGPVMDPPFDVEWGGDKPGKKKVKSAKQLVELRAKLALDPKALAAAKAAGADPRTGEDDCEKKEVDWTRGEPALSCDGRSVTVALRPSAACAKTPRIDTWTLVNPGTGWKIQGKGLKQKP